MPRPKRRAYGVSCRACREKKIACDGVRPQCSGCKDTQETCVIPVSARPLRRLQHATDSESSTEAASSDISNARLAEKLRRVERRLKEVEEALDVPSSPGASSSMESSAQPLETAIVPCSGEHLTPSNSSIQSEYHGAKYRLTIDETGNVVYHGLTSWSQGPNVGNEDSVSSTIPIAPTYGMTEPEFAPIFQGLASSRHISVAPALGDALLETFFCYQVFNIIQRSTFLRDMALGGPMFSEFLLMAMYASATRMIDGLDEEARKTQGALFERLAKEYLAKEMEGPTKITTIKGLLLLSGRECALGNVSQGWNHAGLVGGSTPVIKLVLDADDYIQAFRMIHDLGIHLDPEKVAGASNLSQEERATRDRLFWAAFIWDKSISLAMGREPSFPPRAGRDPSTMADFDDDEEPWTAYFSNPIHAPPQLKDYVYQPKRRVATFKYLAQLCLILHDIIMELYSTESHLNARQRKGFIHKTHQQMEYLWSTVPGNMKYSPSRPSSPPWTFMLQMLYHATAILLHRLLIEPHDIDGGDKVVETCLEHAITANQMAVSFTQTFGERLTYVAMYSSFVAASFDILLLEAHNADTQMGALMRLRTWLGIMEKSVIEVPSIRRSVHHISQSTWAIISKYPMLVTTEAGQWIGSLHTGQLPGISPISAFGGPGTGVGAFDFFELFEPV